MSSKIGKGGWTTLYIATGIIDVVQFAIDFIPPIGEVANEFADIVIGLGLFGYFQLKGVSMLDKPSRLTSLIGVTGLEELTGGLAPAWILDVWYIHRTVKQEEAEQKAQKEQSVWEQGKQQPPLYQNGSRRIENNPISSVSEPAYKDGKRRIGTVL